MSKGISEPAEGENEESIQRSAIDECTALSTQSPLPGGGVDYISGHQDRDRWAAESFSPRALYQMRVSSVIWGAILTGETISWLSDLL